MTELMETMTGTYVLDNIGPVPGREMSAKEAADLIAEIRNEPFSVAQVTWLCRRGRLRAYKPGSEWYIYRSSVEKYAREEHPSGPRPGSHRRRRRTPDAQGVPA